MKTKDLVAYCDSFLQVSNYKDYAPNGLQVEGTPEIQKVITGVTACQALIDEAIEKKADAILVHHGYFWKNEPQVITGMKRKRIQSLLENGINLIAYHLPLDGHQKLGNNASLADLWNLSDETEDPASLVRKGRFTKAVAIEEFLNLVESTLQRKPLHLAAESQSIQTIAWCSGGAQGYMQQAIDWEVDAFLTGEVSEQCMHQAAESNVHFISAGHHATERLGVKRLGEHLAEHFSLDVEFVDIVNPV